MCYIVPFVKYLFYFPSFQSIAIGYKNLHPSSVVVVQAYDPRPSIRIKSADSPDVPFRRYGFVDAIQELDPSGALGLLDQDYKIAVSYLI